MELLELSDTDIVRYTLSQALALNNGRVRLPTDLESIFEKYTMPSCAMERPYNNTMNVRFYDSSKPQPVFAKTVDSLKGLDAYSPEAILRNIRHAFASVAKGKTQLPIVRINQMLIPPDMVTDIAKLFFETIIQSAKKAEEFIEVLFSIRLQNDLEKQIHTAFVKHTMETFRNPPVLEDTSIESGESRTRSHRSATCILLAHLFVYTYPNSMRDAKLFFKPEYLKIKFLDLIFTKAESGDVEEVKNLITVLPILMNKYQVVLDSYNDRINGLYNDKEKFKLSTRQLLKVFIK